MTWSNYDDVLGQMRGFGLVVDGLDIGRMRRCKVEDDREQRGWYMLHELRLDDGDMVLVGSYGIWRGNENNAHKIELGKLRKLTDDQKAALKKRMADDKKRIDAERARTAALAARRAKQVWEKLAPTGECQYLESKGVKAYGLKFSDSGCAYLPLLDAQGGIHGLQILLPKGHKRIEQTGRNKDFWPAGLVKKGHWFQIGSVRDIVLIAEGYATAASIHEATGLPVAVAFDAGNLLPVAEAIKKRHRSAKVLICADDDFKSEGNPGMSAASAAALAAHGEIVSPVFTIDREVGKKGLTDFNDLHLGEGLHTVRAQIEARLDELKWRADAKPRAGLSTQGGGERVALKSMLTLDEAVDRFALVYGGKGTMFDYQEHQLVPKNDVLDILPEHGWRDLRAIKQVVRMDEVGFDPAGTDKRVLCNLWGGWPTTPKRGNCDSLLELLEYLCSDEENYREVFEWVIRWIAYPIQHPGAKMRTALVFHGPQGTGKNLFFEAVMAIYGEYGRIVDQAAIEDKFNDWASRKLMMIADEVVARQELYHVKNKLKSFVTGEWIRINPKNVAAHEERNHVNLVFLSNESQPLVLEKDDRRYTVIHTPEKLPAEFYQQVRAELDDGGIAALHYHLLHLELGDFDEHTKPPMTKAKENLIEISLDSVQRFISEWHAGQVEDAPFCPCLGRHLFITYRKWCDLVSEKSPRSEAQFIGVVKNMHGWRAGRPISTLESFGSTKVVERRMVVPPSDLITSSAYFNEVDSAKREDIANISGSKSQQVWLTGCFFTFANAGEFKV
jgi:putative DNA primase/helicase